MRTIEVINSKGETETREVDYIDVSRRPVDIYPILRSGEIVVRTMSRDVIIVETGTGEE